MKLLKTILMVVGLLLAFALPSRVQAQYTTTFKAQPLLNVPAIWTTNTFAVTNIQIASSLGTNKAGTLFTNKYGLLVDSTNSQNQNMPLLGAADLWSYRDGSPPLVYYYSNLTTYASAASPATISYNIVGLNAAANSAIQFTLSPSWDGLVPDNTGNFDFTFGVTATGTTLISSATNAPLHRWLGAKKVFLTRVVNADADASSGVYVYGVYLNGFVP